METSIPKVPAPHGKERLKALKEKLAHEILDEESRCELADLVAKLSKEAA